MFSDLTLLYQIYLTAVCAFLGLVLGSGLNCLSYRIARGQRWSEGRSVCPVCGHELGARDLVPLFSWLFLRGKCRYCGAPVSVRYPLTELCLAAVYVLTYGRFGLTWDTAVYLVFFSCLFCLSLVDLDIQEIPNRFLVIPAAVRVVQLLLTGGLPALGRALWPALVLGGAVLGISLLMDKVLGRDSMGGGDIKLLALCGLFFSFPCCLFLVICACVVGILVAFLTVRAKKEIPFPFGPAISMAAFITAMVGEQVVGWYIRLFMA